MCIKNAAGKERVLKAKGVKIVIDGHGGRLVRRRSFFRRALMYLVSAIVGFGALFAAMMMDYQAYAAGLPEIFMGTFSDVFVGAGNDDGSKDEVAQMPEVGDVIETTRTVVILGSKWKLRPGFQIAEVMSSDPKVVSVSRKKYWGGSSENETTNCGDAGGSDGQTGGTSMNGISGNQCGRRGRNTWSAVIKAKKAGMADITLTSVDGETRSYQIIVEDPQVRNLKVVDFVRLGQDEYITGTKYLKPTAVKSSKRKIAQVYGYDVINVFGSGRTKITVQYGKYKRSGKIRAKLPHMASKDVKLSNKTKRIRLKNVPQGWKVQYISTDPTVAVCNANGDVAPRGNGTCSIYTKIGNTYLFCHVTVDGFKK